MGPGRGLGTLTGWTGWAILGAGTAGVATNWGRDTIGNGVVVWGSGVAGRATILGVLLGEAGCLALALLANLTGSRGIEGLGGRVLIETGFDLGFSSLLGLCGRLGGKGLRLRNGSCLGFETTSWLPWNTLLNNSSSGLSLSVVSGTRLLKASNGLRLPRKGTWGWGEPLIGCGVPLIGCGVPLIGTWGWGVLISGDCLRGVVGRGLLVEGTAFVVVGTKEGLLVVISGSLKSFSSLRLGFVKNNRDALILGFGVVFVTKGSGTAGKALNVVIGTDWPLDSNPVSSIGRCELLEPREPPPNRGVSALLTSLAAAGEPR